MKQTKLQSFVEANVNVFIGFILSCLAGYIIYPCFGVIISHKSNLGITLCFTVISILRSYIIRRYFNNKNS